MQVMAGEPTTNQPPNWEQVTLELQCPRCGYNLRMLTGCRCPECGLDLEWGRIIASAEKRFHSPLFEYKWRTKPVRSYFDTLWLCMRPWRLWKEISLTDDPQTGGLILFALVTGFFCGFFLLIEIDLASINMWRGLSIRRPWWSTFILESATWSLLSISLYFAIAGSTWLFFQIFQQTISHFRIRQVQILRVIVLSYTPCLVIMIVDRALAALLIACLPFASNPAYGGSLRVYFGNSIIELFSLAYIAISLWYGLSTYLKIPRGGLTAVILFGLTFLFWFTMALNSVWFSNNGILFLSDAMVSNWPGLELIVSELLRL